MSRKILMSCILAMVVIIAAMLGISSCGRNGRLTSITVLPGGASIIPGTALQYQAQGLLSDGTMYFLSIVDWSSSAATPTIATIDPVSGLAVASSTTGTVIITAADPYSNFTGTTSLHVDLLSSITVTPYLPSMTPGLTHQFAATGYLANGATQDLTSFVTWTTDNPAVATIVSTPGLLGTGIVTSVAGTTGTSNIIASIVTSNGTGTTTITGSTTLTVTSVPLATLAVAPLNPIISMATTTNQQIKATGTYSDGTTQDGNWTVRSNWNSSNPAVATIDPYNPAAAAAASINYITVTIVGTGTTAITATDPITGVAASTTLTVTP